MSEHYDEGREEEDDTSTELESYTDIIEQLFQGIKDATTTLNTDQHGISVMSENNVTMHTTAIIKLTIKCNDVENTFLTNEIRICPSDEDEDVVEITVFYYVYHLSQDDEFSTTIEVAQDTCKADAIFEILWNYKLCPECLKLVKKTEEVCGDCLYHKMRQQYGLKKQFIETLDTCTICQDPVYNNKLQCGHSIHRSCILGLNTKTWYDKTVCIQCPVCRKELSAHDKNRFFSLS
jgi:hypothetical protein